MLTADTITDEQIRELRDQLLRNPFDDRAATYAAVDACDIALGSARPIDNATKTPALRTRESARSWCAALFRAPDDRARCAEILNARGDK
jgi:hypothetical protein